MAHTHQRCFPCLLYSSFLSSKETPTQKGKKRFYCALKSVPFCSKVNAGFWQPTDGNVFNTVKVNCHYSKDWKWMSARGNYCLVFVSGSLLKDFRLAIAKAQSNICFLQLLIFIKASHKENLPQCGCEHVAGFSIQTGILTPTCTEAVSRAVRLAFLRVGTSLF